jgi:hypothetical protein
MDIWCGCTKRTCPFWSRTRKESRSVLKITPTVWLLDAGETLDNHQEGGCLLQLDQVMKFIVAHDVSTSANLCSLAKVFREHRNLSGVERSATQSRLNKTDRPLA